MNEQKVILTSQDYFDAVLFDRQALEDKIAYLLFYVTCIAGLRKDMTAKILADRLADLYRVYNTRTSLKMGEKLEYIGEAKIKEILASRHDYFAASSGIIDYSDRKKNECAYCLSKNKFNELQAEFDTRIRKRITVFDRKTVIERLWFLFMIIFLVVSTITVFRSKNNENKSIQFYSLPEYLEAVNLDGSDDLYKGVFFTYYITELTQLREDITPETICERLESLHYIAPNPIRLQELFNQTSLVEKSNKREDAYQMTPHGCKFVEKIVKNFEGRNKMSIWWILQNMTWELVTFLLSLFGGAVTLGVKLSNFLKGKE